MKGVTVDSEFSDEGNQKFFQSSDLFKNGLIYRLSKPFHLEAQMIGKGFLNVEKKIY